MGSQGLIQGAHSQRRHGKEESLAARPDTVLNEPARPTAARPGRSDRAGSRGWSVAPDRSTRRIRGSANFTANGQRPTRRGLRRGLASASKEVGRSTQSLVGFRESRKADGASDSLF